MIVTQLSVFMENKPGSLERILRILGDHHINITALTIAETPDFGILRMIVSDTEAARDILKEQQITTAVTDVLAIEIENRPGALLKAVEAISRNLLNIEYMYAYARKKGDQAVMVFRFEDIEAAKNLLIQEGFKLVGKSDITGE